MVRILLSVKDYFTRYSSPVLWKDTSEQISFSFHRFCYFLLTNVDNLIIFFADYERDAVLIHVSSSSAREDWGNEAGPMT